MSTESNRFNLAALLGAAMGASTFALVIFAVLASEIIAEFQIERWQVGALVTASTVTGALVSPSIGSLVDKVGARRSTYLTLFFAAAAIGGVGASPTFQLMIAIALINGVFQAIANPATNKLIALQLPPGRRGFVTGIKQSGVQFGTFMGGLLLPLIALLAGWRAAVLAFAAFWAIGGVLAMVFLPAESAEERGRRRMAQSELPPFIWRLTAYGFVLGAGGTAVFTYLPLFAEESLAFSKQSAGYLVAFVGLVGVVGRVGWGHISELHVGPVRSLRIIAVLAAVSGWLLVASVSVPWLVWPAALVTAISASSWNSVGMLSIIQTLPASVAGRGSGVVLMGFMLGLGIGAPAFGYSVDRLGTYTPGWLAISAVFLTGLAVIGSEESNPEPWVTEG